MTTQPSTIHDLREALDAYVSIYMPSRNFAPKTRQSYGDDIRELILFLESSGCDEAGEVSFTTLEGYLADLDRRKLAGATRRRKTYAIKSFFTFLHRSGHLPGNPAEQLIPPRSEQKEPRVLSKVEYQALLRAYTP